MLDTVADTATVLRDFRRQRTVRAAGAGFMVQRADYVDPVARILDPEWTESPWLYEDSRTEPYIPGELHDAQVEALNNPARHRLLFWGNQSGKTTVGAIDCVLLALGRHPNQKWEPPVTIWASALTWDLWQKILLPELLTWIPRDRIIDAPEPYVQSMKRTIKIRADNGTVSRIIGKSAEQGAARYQSARVHRVWFDEEHPESIWDEVQPRLLRFGGDTISTITPLLGLTWMYHRLYTPWKQGEASDIFVSHAGVADNPGIGAAEIRALERQFQGDPAQLAARKHGHFAQPAGLALSEYDANNLESFSAWETAAEQKWEHVCGIDFGYWRFAFVHGLVDRAERCHMVHEMFSQKETLESRARRIHDHLDSRGAPKDVKIYGDAANPTDIMELNKEFKRIGSGYRCRAVRAENKARSASVTLLNNLLSRGAMLLSRGLDSGVWCRGQSAASDGQPMAGSRLLFEIGQWRYPKPKGEQAQRQDPDDDTADGGDCIAAWRYLTMSRFKAAKYEKPKPKRNKNIDTGYEEMVAKLKARQRELVA